MKAFKMILLLALLTGAIWFVIVVAWQVNDVQPSGSDLALYLGGLPLLAIGTVLLVRYGLRQRRERAAERAAAPASGVRGTGESGDHDAPAVAYVLHLHAAAVHLAIGATAEEAAANLVEPKRPGLHPSLKNAQGMPVMAAPVDDVDTDAVADALRAIAESQHQDQDFDRLFAEERLRAVALLEPVAEQLLMLESEAVAGLTPPGGESAPSLSGRRSDAVAPPKSRLRTLLLVAESWPQPARQMLGDWLLGKAEALGLPAERIAVEVVPIDDASQGWGLIDQIGRRYHGEVTPDRYLLLACASQLGESSIETLEASQRLLGSGRPEGLVPGEGAAGLWLSGPPEPGRDASPDALELHVLQRGHVAAGTSSRNATRQSSELMSKALACTTHKPDAVTAVVSDADHRPSRAIEIASAIAVVCPELDPVAQSLNLGVACGHLGAVAPWAVIAVAAAQARGSNAPVLAVGLADGEARAAIAVTPVPPPSSTQADRSDDQAA